MSLEKTQSYLRLLKLAGREEEIVPDNYPISEEYENLTETEWADLPRNMKCLKEGKKHVLSFDNEFKLKPIKTDDVEDKGEPELNKTSDYESDGGDAEKANKKMINNDKMDDKHHSSGDTESVKEEGVRGPSGAVPDHLRQTPASRDEHNKYGVSKRASREAERRLKAKGSDLELSSDDEEEAELRSAQARKDRKDKERQSQAKADEILKTSTLRTESEEQEDEKVEEQFENPQEFDDKDAEEYYGLDGPRETKVSIPSDIMKSINAKIKEIEASIGEYDTKGYNDGDGANSNKNKAIDALEQIKDNLSSKDYEGFKEAKLFYLTLMSPITDLFPADLVNFLAVGTDEDDGPEFGKEVEPFETSLKESYMFKRQDAFNRFFIDEILPQIVQQYGYEDKPAIDQTYNDTLDSYQKDGMVPDSSNNWTLPDEVTQNPSKFLKENVKTIVEYGTNEFGADNTAVETWFERDRKYVGLYPVNEEGGPDTNKKAIVEWWDDSVDEAVEDGYLDPRDWHGSALDYAKQMGVIKESKSSYSLKKILNKSNKRVFEASGLGDYKVYFKGKPIGHTLSNGPVEAAKTVMHGKYFNEKGRDAASQMRKKMEQAIKAEDDLSKFSIEVVKDEGVRK